MNITCPYCYSANITQQVEQHSSDQNLASIAGAGIGATISKQLGSSISPIVGGIAGALVGGLIDSFLQPEPQQQVRHFYHCHNCQRNFG